MVSGLVRQLESAGESEVASSTIGGLVMEALRGLDPVAYVRFASVYRDFREASDFHEVLGEIAEPAAAHEAPHIAFESPLWRRRRSRSIERRCAPRSAPRRSTPDDADRAGRGGARLGRTAPNPSVGAVIADERTGEVIARGWTAPGGRPHAETEAIARAGDARARRHHVRDARAVLAPRRDAAVRRRHRRGRPGARRVRHRGSRSARRRARASPAAQGGHRGRARADASRRRTGSPPGTSCASPSGARWCSQAGARCRGDGCRAAARRARVGDGPEARAAGHLLRARADAILVGRRTVIDDDPLLTCRLPGLASALAARIVLARALPQAVDAKLSARPARADHPLRRRPRRRRSALRGRRRDSGAAVGGEFWRLDLAVVAARAWATRRHAPAAGRRPDSGATLSDGGLVDEVVIGAAPSCGRQGPRPIGDRRRRDLRRCGRWLVTRDIGPDRLRASAVGPLCRGRVRMTQPFAITEGAHQRLRCAAGGVQCALRRLHRRGAAISCARA